ncbi:MAG: M1 family metallopeptidase [Balneolales bacterium]|nr:M1 family metallopeptidase [Balneolales bacterium]
MRYFFLVSLVLIVTLAIGCSTPQPVTQQSEMVDAADTVDVVKPVLPADQEVTWIVPDRPEQFLRPRTWNLEHQKIWVRFDYAEQAVIGQTELFLTSFSSVNEQLILDAKTMKIHAVTDVISGNALEVIQDSATITIPLPVTYATGDTLIIHVDYTAYPPSRGLYFVNADGSDPNKPTQIWTLGQPEDNSFWLPTIDHPAERATQETWISVPDRFQTLSNGALIDSRILPGDSLRTDYWQMPLPHAPYLFALAVGEYSILERFREGVVLKYYVEPSFEPYAEIIYRDTDDMIRFFSEKLNVPYPWSFYAQAPVHDFIASGMENTTASFYFNNIQITERQSMDVDFQDLIAHELIHQWFGNLVTCKDWANLPINEGFANYFETLYRNHRNGFDASQWKSLTDRNSYFNEAQRFRRPIITNRYNEPEDMYDRHTYEKTGLVLRMLHHYVGDNHWWGALNGFLEANRFGAVDWTDVMVAFEKETGMVLKPFFEQWFTSIGHPDIHVTTWYDEGLGYVRLQQVQNLTHQPVFDLNIDIHYFDEIGENHVRTVQFNRLDSTYVFEDPTGKLGEMVVDPHRIVLAEYREKLSYDDLISRLAHPSVPLRYEALMTIRNKPMDASTVQVLLDAFAFEQSPPLRNLILTVLTPHLSKDHEEFIHGLTSDNEPYFRVRMRAADISLALFGLEENYYLNEILHDPSYYVEKHVISLFENNK